MCKPPPRCPSECRILFRCLPVAKHVQPATAVFMRTTVIQSCRIVCVCVFLKEKGLVKGALAVLPTSTRNVVVCPANLLTRAILPLNHPPPHHPLLLPIQVSIPAGRLSGHLVAGPAERGAVSGTAAEADPLHRPRLPHVPRPEHLAPHLQCRLRQHKCLCCSGRACLCTNISSLSTCMCCNVTRCTVRMRLSHTPPYPSLCAVQVQAAGVVRSLRRAGTYPA